MKKIYKTLKWVLPFMLVSLIIQDSFAQTKTITRSQYRDKTLAMILGSVGGVLTGYEYLNVYNTPNGFYQPGATQKVPKEPLLGMPDDWFILMNGTLGGTTKDEYNYAPWIEGIGRINSDDDQHIDFFNQWLLNQYGLTITYEDIKHEWMSKEVSDFGGGQGAIEVMRDKDLMVPQCGQRDHGNTGHWLPECYIEHEMMGAAFPGMPNKAVEFTKKFSEVTGEGENVQWGYFWAAAHSIAFLETDARTVLDKARSILPANSRVRQMYDICKMLQQKYPSDWRAAVRELWKDHWRAPFAVGYDGVMMLGDVNNGTAFLSILYGNNDYMETLKIASLAGGDGDCTASAVGGLMGIIKGMAGTPQVFKDRIYVNGTGVWIDDIAHAFSIKKDFKLEWKYDELADMYQQNAEMSIRAYGGVVTADSYTIKTQSGTITQIPTVNWDFESGNLDGWKTWTSGGSASIWNERQCNDNTQACYAATGNYKGTIVTQSNTAEAKLYQTVAGLKPGATYKIQGRINTANGRLARFYVDNYGGPYKYASIYHGVSPFPYLYLYVTMGPSNTSLDVGLHAPPTENASKWCSIDDIIITEIEHPVKPTRYEAENSFVKNAQTASSSSASGGAYVGWLDTPNDYIEFDSILADYTGEYILRINYANEGAFAQQRIDVNGRYAGLIEHSDTGPWGVFSANVTDAYVKLNKGLNTVRISAHFEHADIDYIDVFSPYGSEGRPATDADLVDGGIYRILSRKSGKALDVNGAIVNGSKMTQNTFIGSPSQYFRLIKSKGIYTIQSLSSTQAVEIAGAGMDNGNPVELWGDWKGENQQWAILDAGEGFFKVVNQKSGKVMDVAGGSMSDGAGIIQWDYLNASNQQWRFDYLGTSADNLPHFVPGTIEAEAYSDSSGIQSQVSTDSGGGKNIGWIESGDWVEYNVRVESTGRYLLKYRVASADAVGKISLYQNNDLLRTTNIAVTGGWQNWTTVTDTVTLLQGLSTLTLVFEGNTGVSLFNLNWFSLDYFTDCNGIKGGYAFIDSCGICAGGNTGITPVLSSAQCVVTGTNTSFSMEVNIFPNPFEEHFLLKSDEPFSYSIYSIQGILVEQGNGEKEMKVGDLLPKGSYVLTVRKKDKVFHKVIIKN